MNTYNHIIPEKATKTLQNGGVVVGPTETVYGIFGDARSLSSKQLIYALKGRPEHIPVQLMVRSVEEASVYGVFNGVSEKLAERFWPGGLTLVVPAKPDSMLAKNVIAEDGTIGIRIPDHPFPHALMHDLGAPIIASSANLSGEPSAMDFNEAVAIFGNKVDVYDDMTCRVQTGASSVLRVAENSEITWFREGANARDIRIFIDSM